MQKYITNLPANTLGEKINGVSVIFYQIYVSGGKRVVVHPCIVDLLLAIPHQKYRGIGDTFTN
ncbi:MAG: hypothetical protein CK532_04920 [Flavobacteriales bacterium]|nr:MAG: hypothetical protein CK532_04920 [Flavobacteriales bacterium]